MAARFYLRQEGRGRFALYGPNENRGDSGLELFGTFSGKRPAFEEVEEALSRRGYEVIIDAIEPRRDGDGHEVFYSSRPVRAASRAIKIDAGATSRPVNSPGWRRWWKGRPAWLNWLTAIAIAGAAAAIIMVLLRHPAPVSKYGYNPTPDQLNELLKQIAAVLGALALLVNAIAALFIRGKAAASEGS